MANMKYRTIAGHEFEKGLDSYSFNLANNTFVFLSKNKKIGWIASVNCVSQRGNFVDCSKKITILHSTYGKTLEEAATRIFEIIEKGY